MEGGSLNKNLEIAVKFLDEIKKTNNSDCLKGIGNAIYL